METIRTYSAYALLVGTGATAVMDLWAVARRSLLGIALPDYGLVGRWIGHMAHGQFRHHRIGASPPLPRERLIGWSAHYLTGVAFAGVLLVTCGLEWARQPTLAPALVVGIATVAAPFLIMQPGMGNGFAASRAPHPAAARFQSLVTHTFFGIGLYVAGWAVSFLFQHRG